MILTFYQAKFETPLGSMTAVADDKSLYLLEFLDQKGFEKEMGRIEERLQGRIILGETKPIQQIRSELDQYFQGTLRTFQTPISGLGTPFQHRVWKELQNIPFGQTLSYSDLACAIGRPTARRAVARANSLNPLAIIVPCHRVIEKGGGLGGYAGGVARKEQLLKLESNAVQLS